MYIYMYIHIQCLERALNTSPLQVPLCTCLYVCTCICICYMLCIHTHIQTLPPAGVCLSDNTHTLMHLHINIHMYTYTGRGRGGGCGRSERVFRGTCCPRPRVGRERDGVSACI